MMNPKGRKATLINRLVWGEITISSNVVGFCDGLWNEIEIARNENYLWNFLGFLPKNLSYIPLPNPMRRNSLSTPSTGTIAQSILAQSAESLGSYTPKDCFCKGSLYRTALKLSPPILGKKILTFLFCDRILKVSLCQTPR